MNPRWTRRRCSDARDQPLFWDSDPNLFNDHDPPHFHALYGEDESLIEIESLAVYRGELPRRALAMVLEWAALHREELRRD